MGTISDYLADQSYLEMKRDDWAHAARLFYDLRRQGITVRSTIDCCIAQLAMSHQVLLIHNDRDFEAIAQVCPLQQLRFRP
jgi:predicted nucleic acid-binding protein